MKRLDLKLSKNTKFNMLQYTDFSQMELKDKA